MKTLSVPETHQKRVAMRTLKMSDVGAYIMGGMTKLEARAFLLNVGYTETKLNLLEGWNEN